MATWRAAKSLVTLRDQVNAIAPSRKKDSDGMKGDDAHAARKSDHNPNDNGIVLALDITNDPANGVNARALAEALVDSRDPRIKYVISNRQICSSKQSPWKWRPYDGANAHEKHCHLSVMDDPSLYDDARPWAITAEQLTGTKVPIPAPQPQPAPTTLPPTRKLPQTIAGSIEERIRELLMDMSSAATAAQAGAFSIFKTSLLANVDAVRTDIDTVRSKIAAFDLSSARTGGVRPPSPAPDPVPAAEPPGTPVVTGDNAVSLIVSERLRAAGVSEAGIAGILGNIKQESDFNPKSRVSDQPKASGEARYAHGLFQVGRDEWDHYDAWLHGRDWTDPALQIEFMIDNLQRHYPKVWAEIKSADDPATAALTFSSGYEKPSPKYANNANRVKWAQHYFTNRKIVKRETPVAPITDSKIVDVMPATRSKINWVAGVKGLASAILLCNALLGTHLVPLSAEAQVILVGVLNTIGDPAIVVMRTWFSSKIVKQSADKA